MIEQIVPWFNFIALLVLAILILFFYARSVSIATLEKRIGAIAYQKCARYRIIASIIMVLTVANYIVYFFYPLPIPFPCYFPWDWPISVMTAIAISIPSLYLWLRGVKDAGKETIRPMKRHRLYGGIYKKIRHPQAVGEIGLYWVISFLLNSPFLVLITFIWIPLVYEMCKIEERDLIARYGELYLRYLKSTPFMVPRRKKQANARKR
nr:NnrU family protein [Candidatus Njordarchaeota archaeon]